MARVREKEWEMVQVEESELRKVQGLESVRALVPMLVEVREKEWEMVEW